MNFFTHFQVAKVITAINRFPVTSVLLGCIALLFLCLINSTFGYETDETIIRLIVTGVLGVWIFAALKLWVESVHASRIHELTLSVIGGFFLIWHYLMLPNNPNGEWVAFEFIIHGAFFTSLFSVPFLVLWIRNHYREAQFYSYVINFIVGAFEASIVGVGTFLLGAATYVSVDILFALDISERRYAEWAVFSFVLIGPGYFLVQFQHTVTESLRVGEKFLHFLIKYLTLPFITIYLAILYLYTIKVLSNFSEWPEGIVSWLVIWFSFFGYVVYLFSYHARDVRPVAWFRIFWPYLLLPQIVMLFYAIGLRIEQHGFTINRYLIVVFGLWLLLISLYFIVSRGKRLVVVPGSLFVGMMLIIVGPWSVFSVPVASQLETLEDHLLSLEIIRYDPNTYPPDVEAPTFIITPLTVEQGNIFDEQQRETAESARSVIRYLCYQHDCAHLDKHFRGLKEPFQQSHGLDDEYYSAHDYISAFGLDYAPYGKDGGWGLREVWHYYNLDNYVTQGAIDMSEYESGYYFHTDAWDTTEIAQVNQMVSVIRNDDQFFVAVPHRDVEIDITDSITAFAQANQEVSNYDSVDVDRTVIKIDREDINVLIHVIYLSSYAVAADAPAIQTMKGFIFYTLK